MEFRTSDALNVLLTQPIGASLTALAEHVHLELVVSCNSRSFAVDDRVNEMVLPVTYHGGLACAATP